MAEDESDCCPVPQWCARSGEYSQLALLTCPCAGAAALKVHVLPTLTLLRAAVRHLQLRPT